MPLIAHTSHGPIAYTPIGELGRVLGAIGVFELGNIAATLLILRATDLLDPGRSTDSATQIAIALYVLYNLAATLTSVPAGHVADRRTPSRIAVRTPTQADQYEGDEWADDRPEVVHRALKVPPPATPRRRYRSTPRGSRYWRSRRPPRTEGGAERSPG